MPRYVYLFAATAALFAAPASSFAELPLLIHSRICNSPGQQLCQVDHADRRYREICAPQSYHPYGITGYRPLGTYRSRPRLHPYVHPYVLAPNAKIIRIRRRTTGGPDSD
ncbi:MAG TPA: hypothetical protein VNL39_12750 [Xanthobacteraceae bacterium]|nr:hypothetical protein [Xanthobacteraceae bacterium]